jgi:hypothetical protein
VFLHEDFLLEEGTAITGSGIWVAQGTNDTPYAAAAAQSANGVVVGATGASASDNMTLRTGAVWMGDLRCGVEFRWQVDVITTLTYEMGFTDPLTSFDDLAMGDIDTPAVANGAADVALVAQQVGATLTTMAFVTDGSTSNMNTTKTDLGTRSIVAATYQTVRVQLNGDLARCWVFDENGALQEQAQHGDVLASRIEGGTLLHAWHAVETTTGAKVGTIDYVTMWQDRF